MSTHKLGAEAHYVINLKPSQLTTEAQLNALNQPALLEGCKQILAHYNHCAALLRELHIALADPATDADSRRSFFCDFSQLVVGQDKLLNDVRFAQVLLLALGDAAERACYLDSTHRLIPAERQQQEVMQ